MSLVGRGIKWLVIVIGAISLVTLSAHSFDIKLSAVLTGVVERVESFFDWLILNALEPYVASLVAWIGALVGWPIPLQGHWKDTFILLNLYFAKNVAQFARGVFESESRDDRIRSALVATSAFPIGVFVALLVAALSGMISIREGDWWSATAFASLPALGFFVYSVLVGYPVVSWQFDLVKANSGASDLTRRQFLARQVKLAAVRSAAALAIGGVVLAGAKYSGFVQPPAGGLLAVLAQVALLALYWRLRGEDQAKKRAERLGENIGISRGKVGNIQLGDDMLKVLGSALIGAAFDQLILVPLGY